MSTRMDADIVGVIEMRLDQLSLTERAIAGVILEDPRAASEYTIGQLATKAGSSEATVTRFCRTIGLKGYPQLRLRLAVAMAERRNQDGQQFAMLSDVEPDDSTATVLAKIRETESRALEVTLDGLDIAAVERAVRILRTSRRTLVFGVGPSATAAFDATAKLGLSGLPATLLHDVHAALMTTTTLERGEALLAFTQTGRARDAVDVINHANDMGADSIVITGDPTSPAARAGTVTLVAAARESTFRSGGVSSRLVQLAIVDVLFVLLAKCRYDAAASQAEQMREAVAAYVIRSNRGDT